MRPAKRRRMYDNNGFYSPLWEAYWAKIDAIEKQIHDEYLRGEEE